MKMQLECFACILGDVLDAGSLLLKPKDLETLARRSVNALAGFDPNKTPSFYITRVHRLLKKISRQPKPFWTKRRATNRIVNIIAGRIAKTIKPDFNGFRALLRWVIWSNTLDFRTAGKGYRFGTKQIERELGQSIRRGLAVDDSKKIWRAINKSRAILYILDNVGEIAFDKILVEKFLKGKEVIACVRGGVMTSDAVRSDLSDIGFDAFPARIITSGSDTLGVLGEELSAPLRSAFKTTDLVISKGQANYYFFSSFPEATRASIVCLFTTKCAPVARRFGQTGTCAIAKIMDKHG